MRRAGFVLVGGQSSRMGQNKALLPYRGTTLAGYVATQVLVSVGSVSLIGDPKKYRALGHPVISDELPGHGPLGGIYTVLQHSESEWNLIVACDMPGITTAFLNSLINGIEECDGRCLVPRSLAGDTEPLCAIYHRDCLTAVKSAVLDGRLKVRDLLAELRPVFRDVPDTGYFRNANTPSEWAAQAKFPREL